MISKSAARQIPVPEGRAWGMLRHLANSRTPVTASTFAAMLAVFEDERLELDDAEALLREAAGENMGWFRYVTQEDDGKLGAIAPSWQGRL